ncbi:3'(2'),5'-bisphosphate nucleotidase CysQ [Urechidicola vernalis]|uniref:3'(2'),5'-bisphosphate nucleotidase CysQ n=1 Tax=Urechidicola vernalis TaxID=3075600 RepID=A0ABU2Y7F8_9FLAO|nr:3'(2'),5'-bisphosphate nucleotidase CysQ [Urechidicola sp. P050]MDT0554137.1 3'(2'),5'-bisphosphate nucleotidase CysQ [Urechidicola sp. P050]
MNYDLLTTVVIKAALEAGNEILKVYDSENFEVQIKSDNTPLTIADEKANAIINSYLVQTDIPIISEENKQTSYSIRQYWDSCWIVDPLDGTKEFINRNGEFTVNIALVEKGQPIIGVIYAPVTKTLYYADVKVKKALKAVLNSHDSTIEEVIEKSVSLKLNRLESDIIRVVGSRSHMNNETLNFIEEIRVGGNEIEVVSIGSSLKFCLIAEGSADVYPRFAPTMEWDTAAGQVICNAVGVEVISQKTNLPLRYNKENLLNPSFICKKK